MKLKFYFVLGTACSAVLSSCATFENLTDDRTRLEDDEMYWNRKELFFDPNQYPVTNKSATGDDYYDPNSAANYSNQYTGATNPVAAYNPLSGWQLSYGLSTFNNYFPSMGSSIMYGMGSGYGSGFGFGSGFGYGSGMGYGYGMNNYYGSPYYGSPYYGGMYGSYSPFYSGFMNQGYYNSNYYGGGNPYYGGYGSTASHSGDSPNITHQHRTPPLVGSTNNSSYQNGVLRKNMVSPVAVAQREPVAPTRYIPGSHPVAYSSQRPTYSAPSHSASTPDYYDGGSRSNGGMSSPSHSPNYSSPSRQDNSPSYSAPSRGNSSPSYSAPHNTSSPSRGGGSPSFSSPSHSSPSPSPSRSAPSHSSSPGRR